MALPFPPVPRPAGLVFALAAWLASGLASAQPARVFIDSLPCPNPSQAARAIERYLDQGALADQGVSLHLRSPSQGVLQVSIDCAASGVSDERTLTFSPQDCADLPHTIALLVQAVLDSAWRQALIPSPSPESAESIPGGPRSAITSDNQPADAAPELPPEAAPGEEAGRSPPPAGGSLMIGLLGGPFGALQAPGKENGLRGSVFADFRLTSRWSLGTQVDLTSPVYAPDETLSARTQVASLLARLDLGPASSSHLALLAGAAMHRIGVHKTGGGPSSDATRVDVGLVLGARWHQPIAGPFSAVAGCDLSARSRRDKLHVDAKSAVPALVLSPVRLSLSVGLAWTLK